MPEKTPGSGMEESQQPVFLLPAALSSSATQGSSLSKGKAWKRNGEGTGGRMRARHGYEGERTEYL